MNTNYFLGEGWQQVWLIGLLVLWALLLFGGFVFGKDDATRRMPTWTRMASSLTLVVAAWSWYAFSRSGQTATFALLLALGMSLGFVGDLFMAGLLGSGRSTLSGMASFGLGHLLYISAIFHFGNQEGLNEPAIRWGALLVWWLVALVGWYLVVFRGHKATVLHWAALPYALLLASTAGAATGLALQANAFVPLAIGSALFLISDLILATQLFNNAHFPLIGDVVWLTYGPAQMLIVYAAGAAHMVVG